MKKGFCCLLLGFVLSACTGTQEVGVARLIVIASGGEEPKLSLVQDVFFSDRNATNRFQFLKTLSLPANPISYDIVDRLGERKTLVLISQNDTDTFLSLVNLSAINPAAPSAFDFVSFKTLALSGLVAEGESRPFKPIKLQVSKTGRYVAISHSLELSNAIDVLDLEASGGPRLLERFSDRILSQNLFLDQAEASAQLFFFVEQASGAVLTYFNLPNLNPNTTAFTLPDSRVKPPLDLQTLNRQLVALQRDSFTPIANPTATPSAGSSLATLPDALRFIPTNSADMAAVVLLSASELGAHRNSSSELQKTAFSAIDGSIEPFGGFAYFITNGTSPIRLFDVQTFMGNPDTELSRLVQSYAIGNPADDSTPIAINDAVFITWAIAKPSLVTP